MLSRRRAASLVSATALLAGCASAACRPVTIVVAQKDERSQLESEPRGLRTDERGRLSQVQRQVIVTDFWVADTAGRWYRVDEATWRTAEPGRPLTLCR